MDAVSYAHSAKQAKRIKKFIENPDSNSGIVTVPKVIGAGENITIPAGRVAVLPNVQVDGTLNIEGEVFIPSGGSYTDTDIESNNAVFDTLKVQGQNVSPFSGFKNHIINGKKQINQRGLTSTDNSYNQDRWYKAGNNWYQGIEGINLINGKKYTLSWDGTATASYYVGTATSAAINTQTFTPIDNGGNFTLTISAGQNLWIKFASDSTGSTFNFVQLEEGSVATPFEQRPYGLELSLCQRYFEVISVQTFQHVCYGQVLDNSLTTFNFTMSQPKRQIPTIITSGDFYNASYTSVVASNSLSVVSQLGTTLTLIAPNVNGRGLTQPYSITNFRCMYNTFSMQILSEL